MPRARNSTLKGYPDSWIGGGGSPQVALKGAMQPKETLIRMIGKHFGARSSRMGSTPCVLNKLHTYVVIIVLDKTFA